MAGVNGVEIKVGQVWRCRDGVERKVVGNDGHYEWPWDLENGHCVTDNGGEFADGQSNSDLIELVKDENGFTIWRGGEQPTDSATLAEETLVALGWTFDGQAWVENAVVTMAPNALDVQVGGTHYKDCAIQPIEYIHANKLGFAEGNVVKYITRHRQKHGADDVRKVIHYCQLLLELEYGAGKTEGGA
jgi:hypothetical protein